MKDYEQTSVPRSAATFLQGVCAGQMVWSAVRYSKKTSVSSWNSFASATAELIERHSGLRHKEQLSCGRTHELNSSTRRHMPQKTEHRFVFETASTTLVTQ
ncbi:MAG: hypothetical protein WBV71_11350 [Roseobacter sp.]